MTTKVLDIGNCNLDHGSLKSVIQGQFDAELVRAHDWRGAQEQLKAHPVGLIVVNRLLDQDGTSGLEIIRQLKQEPAAAEIPVMLITNYAEYQDQAMALGAERGFGKSSLGQPETATLLGRYLPRRGQPQTPAAMSPQNVTSGSDRTNQQHQ